MDIKKILNNKIMINGRFYETPGYIQKWIHQDKHVVVACCRSFMFIDSEGQKFYSYDIIDDCRYVPSEVKEDERVTIDNNFDSLDAEKIKANFEEKSVSMLFCDTIHTYEQVKAEYDTWEPYLTDDAIITVDDIRDEFWTPSDPRTKWRFHEEWEGDKFDVTDYAHFSGFGIYLK